MSSIVAWLQIVIWLLVTIPSFLLYVVFLAALIRYRKELNSRFFDICISLGVTDLVVAVMQFLRAVRPYYDSDEFQSEFRQKMLYYTDYCINNGSQLAQLCGLLILAVNRFTAIVLPAKHRRMWGPSASVAAAVVIQYIPSAFYISLILFHPMFELKPSLNDNNHTVYHITPEAFRWLYTFVALYIITIGPFIAVLYMCMVVKIVLHRHHVVSAMSEDAPASTEQHQKRAEKRLALIGLLLTSVVFYMLVYIVLNLVITDTSFEKLIALRGVFKAVHPFVLTVLIFSNPYLLLAMSTPMRKYFLKFIRRN